MIDNIVATRTLEQCEAVIERGLNTFVEVGAALLQIRDGRLYKAEYSTFEDYCRERWGFTDRRARMLIDAAETVSLLETGTTVPVLPATESQARPLTALPTEQQAEAWKIAVETAPEGKITAAHVQSVVDEIAKKPHVANNSGNNEWYTPSEYIDAARRVMGRIDMDPASSEIANGIVGASAYYTAQDSGLEYSWSGRVWMNPPYASELIGKFTSKLSGHFLSGEVTEAIVLVNNATETAWFQEILSCASAVCLVRGRIKFIDMDGNATGAPLQGQAILYMGNNQNLFIDEFSKYGKVLWC